MVTSAKVCHASPRKNGGSWKDVYDCHDANEKDVFRRLEGDCLTTTFIEHPVTCMDLNLKEDLFYCGHVNGYISIFSFLTKKLIVTVRAHNDCVNVLFVKYPILVSGGSDGAVRLWNSKEPKSQCLIEIKNVSEVGDLCMSEYHIFTGDQSGYVCAWNIITGQKEQELTLGGIPSPILSIHSKKNSNNVQVTANTAHAVYSIQLDLWDVKNKPLFGPPHKKCCASFMAPGEKQREPLGISSSAYKKITLMKRCCVHKTLRDQLHKDAFYKSILAFVVNEVPSSFAMPAVSLKPFKRLVNFSDTTFRFDEMYRRHFPLVTLDSSLPSGSSIIFTCKSHKLGILVICIQDSMVTIQIAESIPLSDNIF
ncbi:uncharacterized protein LOC124776159 [Schistocerca piceifrons]|uniref:uncharacterized protein LOC124776159 n=1 Tax=Schistocerca piceifrons TaxID=274613 RepID=UPI001F5F7B44|nr:uncharacterized protein LOC124776159 [Schistocerca piceifrons]